MKKNTRNRTSRALALVCLSAVIVGSLAYFTDRVDNGDDPFNIAIAEKNIEIVPTDPTPDPDHTPDEDPGVEIEYIWENNNPDTINKIVEPGDKTDLSYNIENGGPNAMDVRETFVLHSSVPLSDPTTYAANKTTEYAPEYWLFKAASADVNGAFEYETATAIDGVVVTKIDSQTYKFEVPAFVLNGTSEEVTGGVDKKELKYQLVFDKYARNPFQASKCTVDYLVEVKQHTDNGPAGGWTELLTKTTTMGSDAAYKTVPNAAGN